MPEPINPYAAPASMEMHPRAAEWLGAPNESLRRVANGLGLVRIGAILFLLIVVVGFVGGIVIGAGGGNLDTLRLFIFILAATAIVATILGLVGKVFCLSTPPETEAQGWIYASVGAEVISLLISAAAFAGAFNVAAQQNAGHVQQLLNIVAAVTFVLYIRKVSLFIGRTDLAQRAITLLILAAIFVGLVIFVVAQTMLGGGNGQANGPLALGPGAGGMGVLSVVVAWSLIIIFLAGLLKYISLLGDLKSAILTGR